VELRTLTSIHDVTAAEWDALDHRGSPFTEHAWLACLEDAGCATEARGWLPCHLALYEGGALVAAAPGYVKSSSEGEFVFDWGWAEAAERARVPYYPKLVVAVPFTPATGARVLVRDPARLAEMVAVFAQATIAIGERARLGSAHVLFCDERESAAWTDAGFLRRLGVQYHWQNRGYRTFEDFLKDLPSKKRTQIRRERAQPARDGVTIRTLAPEELTPELARTMHRIYLTTVDKFTWGRRYLNARFFELVAERFRHRLAWVVAERGGEVVAGAFNVEKGDHLYGRYWGAFVELPMLHFNVCYYHGVEHAIGKGLRVFEPGAGGEHKRARGFRPTVTYSAHHVAHPRLADAIGDFVRHEAERIEAYVASGGDD
jgi:predicted N-acyltransferase